jgi:hypothetical protein
MSVRIAKRRATHAWSQWAYNSLLIEPYTINPIRQHLLTLSHTTLNKVHCNCIFQWSTALNKLARQIPQAANAIATSHICVPNIDGEIVQVQAGERIFHIHDDVLQQSLFFINALKPECFSGRNGKPIDLSNENAITFAAYQQYLYSHQIDTTLNEHLWYRMYILG